MKIINVIANKKAILILAIIGMIGNATFYVFGSEIARMHLISWMMWTIFILSCRLVLNGSLKADTFNSKK